MYQQAKEEIEGGEKQRRRLWWHIFLTDRLRHCYSVNLWSWWFPNANETNANDDLAGLDNTEIYDDDDDGDIEQVDNNYLHTISETSTEIWRNFPFLFLLDKLQQKLQNPNGRTHLSRLFKAQFQTYHGGGRWWLSARQFFNTPYLSALLLRTNDCNTFFVQSFWCKSLIVCDGSAQLGPSSHLMKNYPIGHW